MGVVNSKSTAVTNDDATPRLPNTSYFDTGEIRSSVGLVAALVTDTAGSIYRFIRVPSSVRFTALKLLCDAMAGTTSVQVGVYNTAANGGAAVNASLFATALDIHAGITTPQDVRFQNLSIATGEERLWEQLGLSADPFLEYDICITTVTQAGAAGNMLMEGSWVQ